VLIVQSAIGTTLSRGARADATRAARMCPHRRYRHRCWSG